MYFQGVLRASSILTAVSENGMAVFQQPLGPNPISNGMDWISHPIFNHSDLLFILAMGHDESDGGDPLEKTIGWSQK